VLGADFITPIFLYIAVKLICRELLLRFPVSPEFLTLFLPRLIRLLVIAVLLIELPVLFRALLSLGWPTIISDHFILGMMALGLSGRHEKGGPLVLQWIETLKLCKIC
jgi:hypothetical protein